MSPFLDICRFAFKPVVIELDVTERTKQRFNKFVQLDEESLNTVISVKSEQRSRKMRVHAISPEYENWAWRCLKRGEVVPLSQSASSSSGEM